MNIEDLMVLGTVGRSIGGQTKTAAGLTDALKYLRAIPGRVAGKGMQLGAKGAWETGKSTARLTAAHPVLAGTALAGGAGATHVGTSAGKKFTQELGRANQMFPNHTIRGGLF